MNSDSKIFVGLRPLRKKTDSNRKPDGPKCQWDGCQKGGIHRAPVGRDGEGLYLLFCAEHMKDYGRGYNFASNLSDPVVARYQREAASGARPTWGSRIRQPAEAALPFTVRSGSAKAMNARRNAAERQGARADLQRRKLKVLEAKAFETLGLLPEASPEQIRSRYKQKLKMHHPDANSGDRNSEDELRAAIDAYKILKLNGFC
ncbi:MULTISPECIES: J domain-containing protein [unclassified Rhizobium]|uniref:J domain-containing protein n=1 Tax=unclassified Rhizobium TaxID=2613769 RepID=UPI001A9A2278|nr:MULTISPECIES: J domain-containing protein [unclassified Rhizobium]MBX5160635.1 DnaJ domain-containing protein [Rhizobium sp. NZLR8]MBX5167447.1 DnaJ domain-containing protein [Rhizobium sp. NZLR4b]MBX5174666.1 DnaJ domain-containing protein [Rhizobium sp. NZLR1b]MBX5186272.1 DnaJ domain-containing protein [Rhizobium sp. NZLR5]MBX5191936.1 DnaJ domain-containing protein [Rhizobium sp. NZLR3b]